MDNANAFRALALIFTTLAAAWLHLVACLNAGYVLILIFASSYATVLAPIAYGAMPKSYPCPACGRKAKSTYRWCTECGTGLGGASQIQAYQPPQQVEEAPKTKLPMVSIEGVSYPVIPVLMINAESLEILKKAAKKGRKGRK